MIIPMLCVTIFVILVVWFLLPWVARLMIHSPSAISIFVCLCLVFFFHAEDGIRDRNVAGVQTCALPIYPGRYCRADQADQHGQVGAVKFKMGSHRWEERRVGKECRSRWSPYHQKQK